VFTACSSAPLKSCDLLTVKASTPLARAIASGRRAGRNAALEVASAAVVN
jgi:hypothetical protein